MRKVIRTPLFCGPQFEKLSCPARHKPCADTRRRLLRLKRWYVSLPPCFIRLNSCVVFWPPATQRKQNAIIGMAHPAPPASVSLSLNEPEVMVTLLRVPSRSQELRNVRDHVTYCVAVCGSKKLVWRPNNHLLQAATIRTARYNIQQFYVLPIQCI